MSFFFTGLPIDSYLFSVADAVVYDFSELSTAVFLGNFFRNLVLKAISVLFYLAIADPNLAFGMSPYRTNLNCKIPLFSV